MQLLKPQNVGTDLQGRWSKANDRLSESIECADQQVLFQLALITALNPLANPVGVAEGCQLAIGIEQYDGEWLVIYFSLHHEAAPGLVEVTGLAELDIPGLVFQQAVSVIEPELTTTLVWRDSGRAGGGGIHE